MAGERYVLLGLAPARSRWFSALAHWATAGTVPAEFVKCVSAEELRARLTSGRPFSAALVDTGASGLDRDLVDVAHRAGCPLIVVGPPSGIALEAAGVLDPDLQPGQLMQLLAEQTQMIGRADLLPGDEAEAAVRAWRGRVVAVCGPGGTGASTVAIAATQGGADDARLGGHVLLADLVRNAEQAMLHDARDIVPGLQELVEAHRASTPSADEVRSLTFSDPVRGYRLLLGLRRARAWATVRPRAFEAAFESLRRTHRLVVCDCDADVEGEREGGSIDVEERNAMSRTALRTADVVLVVGLPGMKGLHSLSRVLGDLVAFGVSPGRIVPVINRAPRSPRQRAEQTAALAALMPRQQAAMASPVFLPERKVDDALRDGARLPAPLAQSISAAVAAILDRSPAASPPEPERVSPGSLGALLSGPDAEEAAG